MRILWVWLHVSFNSSNLSVRCWNVWVFLFQWQLFIFMDQLILYEICPHPNHTMRFWDRFLSISAVLLMAQCQIWCQVWCGGEWKECLVAWISFLTSAIWEESVIQSDTISVRAISTSRFSVHPSNFGKHTALTLKDR